MQNWFRQDAADASAKPWMTQLLPHGHRHPEPNALLAPLLLPWALSLPNPTPAREDSESLLPGHQQLRQSDPDKYGWPCQHQMPTAHRKRGQEREPIMWRGIHTPCQPCAKTSGFWVTNRRDEAPCQVLRAPPAPPQPLAQIACAPSYSILHEA